MQVIPLQDVASQTFQVTLDGQSCNINLYQLNTGLFMDLYVGSTLIVAGVICEDRNRIVRDLYLGFIGDLGFVDTQAADDPVSPGLGDRFQLVYLDTFDLAPGQG